MLPPCPSTCAGFKPPKVHRARIGVLLACALGLTGCEPMSRPPLPSDGDGARIEHLAAAGDRAAVLEETPGRPKFPCSPRGAGWAQPGPGGAVTAL